LKPALFGEAARTSIFIKPFWSAVAKRSGDTVFDATPTPKPAVQNQNHSPKQKQQTKKDQIE